MNRLLFRLKLEKNVMVETNMKYDNKSNTYPSHVYLLLSPVIIALCINSPV